MADKKETTLSDLDNEIKRSRTLWEYVAAGFVDAQKRRPLSFYLLLLIPVVLLLGAHMADLRESPRRFAMVLSAMLLFFWLVMSWALNDFFKLYRKHREEQRAAYLETIYDRGFVEQLGKQGRGDDGGKADS